MEKCEQFQYSIKHSIGREIKSENSNHHFVGRLRFFNVATFPFQSCIIYWGKSSGSEKGLPGALLSNIGVEC